MWTPRPAARAAWATRARKAGVHVGRVGAEAGADPPAGGALPALGERQGLLELALLVGAAERRPGQQGAHAGLIHGAGDLVHGEVVVGEAGHAGLDHLGDTQQRPPVDIFGGEVHLHRPDALVEPDIDRHILGDAAEEAHGGVGVGVDQPGDGEHPAGLDQLAGEAGADVGGDGDNPAALDGDIVAGQGAGGPAVDLEHGGAADEEVVHVRWGWRALDRGRRERMRTRMGADVGQANLDEAMGVIVS